MSYLLIALIISFLSILGLVGLGILVGKEGGKGTVILSGFIAAVWWLLSHWIMWGNAVGIYGPTPLFIWIFFGVVIAFVISLIKGWGMDNFKPVIPSSIIGIICFIVPLFICISQLEMCTASKRASLIGNVNQIKDLNKVIEPADPVHICLVSDDMALVSAQRALSEFRLKDNAVPGSRYQIGTATLQFVDGSLWWIFPMEFQGWLKWRLDKQVPGYLRVSAEDPFLPAQAVQEDKEGKEVHIRYLNSACWEFKAKRYLRENGYMTSILNDWTFEVDDSWKPYYTVSVLKRMIGYGGYVTIGLWFWTCSQEFILTMT